MGMEGYLVASAVIGVVAQRLVRVNCRRCSRPIDVKPDEAEFYRTVRGHLPQPQQRAGTGCQECTQTGFFDRHGVFECMAVDDPIRELLIARATQAQLREYAFSHGTRSLQNAACDMVDEGQTTLAEAMRTVYVL
jgi:type II secretory ATPase GspE/PulE/Tfp pilus assembly ATPase PilB-like protein